MKEFLEIGQIVKPQGIAGEVKVRPTVDDVSRFKTLKTVFVGGVAYRVLRAREGGEDAFLMLDGVLDRNTAETLRGKILTVKREDAVSLSEGRYFIADLIGAGIFTEDGEKVGTLDEVVSGKTDVFFATDETGKKFSFPFLKDAVHSVLPEDGKIVLIKKRFFEVVCYED